MKPLRAMVVAALLAAALPRASAGPVETPWVPANAGVMWYQGPDTVGIPANQPPGEPSGAWWLTRRIGVSPHVGEVQHLGSLFHGIYVSVGGAGWVNLSPGCLLPLKSPSGEIQPIYQTARDVAIAATGLDACGVEGIAYDPLLPQRVYVSAFKVADVSLSGANLDPAGVYVSDDLGTTWRRLVGGLRGNGLAVARDGAGPARIVAGFIQEHNGAVGATPGNGSLVISDDDGRTWRNVLLPASGCADAVPTSQRLTPTVAMRPGDPRVIYAGTNAGLYFSLDGGSSWTLAHVACGGVWGVALSPDGQTVYAGDHQGRVLKATVGSTSFSTLTTLGSGKVQDLKVDLLEPRILYAAMWDGGGAAVYRVDGQTGAKAQIGGALLAPVDRSEIPKPFPLDPQMRNGTMPSLFLGRLFGRLSVSTILRGVFTRAE